MIIRNLNESDKETLAKWIAAEPDHTLNTPDWYFENGSKSVMYEDENGPVFAVKYSPALRVDIEFSNDAGRDRIREMLKSGFPDVARQAAQQGFKELVFSSRSKTLIAFCRALGFSASPDFRRVL